MVTLLRLSPLLPLALSNYLYGLTSVDLGSYVLGSWLGMLPGTIAYVTVSTPASPCCSLYMQSHTGDACDLQVLPVHGTVTVNTVSPLHVLR